MILTETLIEISIAAVLLCSGAWALFAKDLFQAVVLYIVFGLMMALAWVRLLAPDVALAEAAIGAGLTGALFLNAIGNESGGKAGHWGRRALASCCFLVMLITLPALLFPAGEPGGLTAQVLGQLGAAGVQQPVTAVLLNFRSFDTWMELAVLFAAVLGAGSLAGERKFDAHIPGGLPVFLKAITPFALMVGGYLLWAGSFRPGGAFQAGAVFGAGAILLLTGGMISPSLNPSAGVRGLLVAGLFAFSLAAIAGIFLTGTLLEFPAAWAGMIILLVELVSALSIGASLFFLFCYAGSGGKR